MNKIHHRFTRQQIESFIEERMTDGVLETGSLQLTCQEDFEKLILAYDISMRKNSRFRWSPRESRWKASATPIRL